MLDSWCIDVDIERHRLERNAGASFLRPSSWRQRQKSAQLVVSFVELIYRTFGSWGVWSKRLRGRRDRPRRRTGARNAEIDVGRRSEVGGVGELVHTVTVPSWLPAANMNGEMDGFHAMHVRSESES